MTAKTTRKQVLDQIKKMGCTVDELGSDSDHLVVDAQKGKVFGCTNSHCLVQRMTDKFNPSLTRSDAYAAIIEDLKSLEDCDDPECDICHGDVE